jgi:hypothetical protein
MNVAGLLLAFFILCLAGAVIASFAPQRCQLRSQLLVRSRR